MRHEVSPATTEARGLFYQTPHDPARVEVIDEGWITLGAVPLLSEAGTFVHHGTDYLPIPAYYAPRLVSFTRKRRRYVAWTDTAVITGVDGGTLTLVLDESERLFVGFGTAAMLPLTTLLLALSDSSNTTIAHMLRTAVETRTVDLFVMPQARGEGAPLLLAKDVVDPYWEEFGFSFDATERGVLSGDVVAAAVDVTGLLARAGQRLTKDLQNRLRGAGIRYVEVLGAAGDFSDHPTDASTATLPADRWARVLTRTASADAVVTVSDAIRSALARLGIAEMPSADGPGPEINRGLTNLAKAVPGLQDASSLLREVVLGLAVGVDGRSALNSRFALEVDPSCEFLTIDDVVAVARELVTARATPRYAPPTRGKQRRRAIVTPPVRLPKGIVMLDHDLCAVLDGELDRLSREVSRRLDRPKKWGSAAAPMLQDVVPTSSFARLWRVARQQPWASPIRTSNVNPLAVLTQARTLRLPVGGPRLEERALLNGMTGRGPQRRRPSLPPLSLSSFGIACPVETPGPWARSWTGVLPLATTVSSIGEFQAPAHLLKGAATGSANSVADALGHTRTATGVDILGPGASLIPFLAHDHPSSARRGALALQRALPLFRPTRPLIRTGTERLIAQAAERLRPTDSGVMTTRCADAYSEMICGSGGAPSRPLATLLSAHDSEVADRSELSIAEVGPSVREEERRTLPSIQADLELTLGTTVTVAYMPWYGFTADRSIVISERLVREDVLSAFEEKVILVSVDEDGARLTRNAPGISDQDREALDATGVVRVGMRVRPGDVLAGRVVPASEVVLSGERKLLEALYCGSQEGPVDRTVRVPVGAHGTVTAVVYADESVAVEGAVQSQVEAEDCVGAHAPAACGGAGTTRRWLRIHIRQLQKPQIGDVVADRHGLRARIAYIAPDADLPILPDGRPVDILLDPVSMAREERWGQLLEVQVGWAVRVLGFALEVPPLTTLSEATVSFLVELAGLQESVRLLIGRGASVEASHLILSFDGVCAALRQVGFLERQGAISGVPKAGGLEKFLITRDPWAQAAHTPLWREPERSPFEGSDPQLVDVFLNDLQSVLAEGARAIARSLVNDECCERALERLTEQSEDTAGEEGSLEDQVRSHLQDLRTEWAAECESAEKSQLALFEVEHLSDHALRADSQSVQDASFARVLRQNGEPELADLLQASDAALAPAIRACLRVAGITPCGKYRLVDGRSGEAITEPVTIGALYVVRPRERTADKPRARSAGAISRLLDLPQGSGQHAAGEPVEDLMLWGLAAHGAAYTLQEFETSKRDDSEGRADVYESILRRGVPDNPRQSTAFNAWLLRLQGAGLAPHLGRSAGTLPCGTELANASDRWRVDDLECSGKSLVDQPGTLPEDADRAERESAWPSAMGRGDVVEPRPSPENS